jgi:FAD/FMN-containing dehydrogenase
MVDTRTDTSTYVVDASGYSGWADKVLLPENEQEVAKS